MKVWIVSSREQDDNRSEIEGVFSTKEKALEYLSQYRVGGTNTKTGKTIWWEELVQRRSSCYSYIYWLNEHEVQ